MTTPALHLIILPALGVDAGYYALLEQALRDRLQADTTVLAPPQPARWGERVLGRVRVGYGDMVQRIVDAVQAIQRRSPGTPVLLLGHSLGGHFALAAASRLGPALDGVVLVASGTPHWRAWPASEQRRLRLGLGTIRTVNALLPWYPGAWLGFGGHQSRQLMQDWGTLARTGRLGTLPALRADASRFATLGTAVLSIRIEGDHLAPAAATDHLLAEFPNLAHVACTVAGSQLPNVPVARRHFAWCRQPETAVGPIADWLSSR